MCTACFNESAQSFWQCRGYLIVNGVLDLCEMIVKTMRLGVILWGTERQAMKPTPALAWNLLQTKQRRCTKKDSEVPKPRKR